MDEINFALLSVYNEDNVRNLSLSSNLIPIWQVQSIVLGHNVAFKYVLAAARFKEKQSARELEPFSPLSFGQLEIPLIILGVGLIISCGVFVVEQQYIRLSRRNKLNDIISQLQLAW